MERGLKKLVDLSHYTILLVDDVTFSRQTVSKLLKSLGHPEIHEAENGDEALEFLNTDVTVDFILSDFKMPLFNGLQLLKALRTGQTKADRGTPFVMITGYSERHLVDMALALDVNAFLTKPVSKQTLSKRLEKMLGNKGGNIQIKPVKVYKNIGIQEAEDEDIPVPAAPVRRKTVLKNIKLTQTIVGKMSSLRGKFQESDIARNITAGVDRLITATNKETTNKVVAFVDDLVNRGILAIEDVPDVLDARDAGPWSANAPVKRKEVSGVWVDSGNGEEKFYALDEIPLGAVLSEDISTNDGSVLIKRKVPLTQQVISILAHLFKAGAVTLASMEIEEQPGVLANFSASPENDGSTMAFDSEGPPTPSFTHAMKGDAGWEISVTAGEIPEGAILTRDIYTTDGRLYMYAGHELTEKVISILRDLEELENLRTNIWIAT